MKKGKKDFQKGTPKGFNPKGDNTMTYTRGETPRKREKRRPENRLSQKKTKCKLTNTGRVNPRLGKVTTPFLEPGKQVLNPRDEGIWRNIHLKGYL